MSGISNSLNIAKSALKTQMSIIDVASHNIANASTPGYSRQEAKVQALSDDVRSNGSVSLGAGVDVSEVIRSRNTLYDELYRKENQSLNYNTESEQLINQVELLFNEPSDTGLSETINNFFNSWQDLANSTESQATRQSVYSSGEDLTEKIKGIYNSLVIERNQVDSEISKIPDQINQISEEIAGLNASIKLGVSQNSQPNDLRDKRDSLLDDLSGYGNVKAYEQEDGSMNVTLDNQTIVEGSSYTKLNVKTESDTERGFNKSVIVTEDGSEFTPKNGKLGALYNFRDSYLPGVFDNLDKITNAFVTKVNEIHNAGYGLDGVTGRNYFNPSNTKASNIELSTDIENISNIAASIDGTAGDNTNAFNISALSDEKIVDDAYSISEYYNGMIAKIGTNVNKAKTGKTNQNLLVTQIDNNRESIKGVNLDEEMVNIIQAQRLYQSAAKMITVIDQLMQEIINLKS